VRPHDGRFLRFYGRLWIDILGRRGTRVAGKILIKQSVKQPLFLGARGKYRTKQRAQASCGKITLPAFQGVQ
jgi:hypothetical protein